MKKYKITLTEEERKILQDIISRGVYRATKMKRAYILLAADESEAGKKMIDAAISKAYGVREQTVERLRKRLVEEGFQVTLHGKARKPRVDKKLDGEVEAHVIALSRLCPPEGRSRWTLYLLAEQMVALGYIDSISHQSVHKILKKTR
jgi:transposase